MECVICNYQMTGKDENLFSTPCGHLHHEKCINDWLKKQKTCPQCRKAVNETGIFQIFLEMEPSGVNEQLIHTRFSDVTSSIVKLEKKCDDVFTSLTDSLEKITMSMSSFEYQNEILRKENQEMQQVVKALENDSKINVGSKSTSAANREQMKSKDFMIANLQKECNDLKTQRAETTREMNTIREQINLLKATAKGERAPLKDKNDQKPPSQSLTLKFDDLSDKLIIE